MKTKNSNDKIISAKYKVYSFINLRTKFLFISPFKFNLLKSEMNKFIKLLFGERLFS